MKSSVQRKTLTDRLCAWYTKRRIAGMTDAELIENVGYCQQDFNHKGKLVVCVTMDDIRIVLCERCANKRKM